MPRKRELARRVGVPRRELLEVRGRAPTPASASGTSSSRVEAHAVGDLREQLVDRRDADRLEHRLAVGVGQREVAGGRSLLGDVCLVGVGVEQRVDLAGVRDPDPDEPALRRTGRR